ncbi:MAG: hypothetical protein COC01_03730 [Bacteroidetes bacterium]|nr:MAG: hypothetical protein COC01_03730 [Bacteroidota bacterium]
MARVLLLLLLPIYGCIQTSHAQCCSGASPIAGGLAQGVLQHKQMEISTNYQYLESRIALTGNTPAPFPILEKAFASYMYSRFAYGFSKKLTISVESGYSPNRTERLIGGDEITGKGIGDLIIFPKYDVFNGSTPVHQMEITVGLGSKIPLGEYNQKYVAYVNPSTQDTFWIKKSPGLQPTSGTKDFIFYAFFYRGYTKSQLRFYTTFTHILRGKNPDGVNYGNITSITTSASKSIFSSLNLGLELKAEKLDTIFDPEYLNYKYNTGGKKLSLVPQLFYTYKQKLTFSFTSDIPVYQFVNGTQIASQYFFNFGVTYRLSPLKSEDESGK